MRKLYLLIILLNSNYTFSQVELKKVAPEAPNTSGILKVSENNISHYTGSADIKFPLYSINSGSLQLNLELNYNSTGNKVEDIASWVGLGWNLSPIPVITRSVRGLPDENQAGVFYKFNGQISLDSVINIIDLYPYNYYWSDIVCQVSNRDLDTDPDIFSYVLLDGRSGTFYWDQKQEKFQTQPFRNFKISKTGTGTINSFELVDEFGNIYTFSEYETTQSSGAFLSEEIRNSWYIKKVINSNRTDSIEFGYSPENIVTKTLNPQRTEIENYCIDNSSLMSTSYLKAKILIRIDFRDGYVKFNLNDTYREDLQGAAALKNIEVYNFKNNIVKKVDFNYSYTTSSISDPLCNLISSLTHEKKRLFLNSFVEKGIGNDSLVFSFQYENSIPSPCRVSSAQDFWGYFNNKTSNINLVPEVPAKFGFTYKVPGANKFVNPNTNQFGILKKIIYPTGGETSFEYETHQIISAALPAVYYERSVYLTPENEVSNNLFIDTFEIISGEDNYINNWSHGGSFIDIIFGDKECTGSNPLPDCAQFYLKGIDSENSDISMPISQDLYGHRLKKGRYEIKAMFGEDPVDAQGFFYLIKWKEVDTTYTNKYVGGLRVKSIIQNDKYGNQSTKKYLYQKFIDKDSSSGVSLSSENLIKNGIEICLDVNNEPLTSSYIYQESNALINSFGGSYVAYNKVYELYDSSGINGYRIIEFLPYENIFIDELPYPPPVNSNEFRAKPTTILDFRNNDGEHQLIKEETFYYNEIFFNHLSSLVKHVYLTSPPGLCGTPNNTFSGLLFTSYSYNIIPVLCNLKEKTTKVINPDNISYSIYSEKYFYNEKNHEINKKYYINSNGKLNESFTYYPVDSTLSGLASNVYQDMVSKNMIAIPVKEVTEVNSSVVLTQLNEYKIFDTRVLLDNIQHSYLGSPLNEEIKLIYSSTDRIIEQYRNNNINEIYLWGYGNRYPVAKIINANYQTIINAIDENILNNPSSDNELRDHLNLLRSDKNIQVISYTYDPLIGVTSITDENGRVSYYYYDSFNRLFVIKDEEGKILKKYCYDINGQSSECNVSVLALWQNTTTPLRCKQNHNNENNGELEKEQIDTNPWSPTFNQTRWVYAGTDTEACPLPCNEGNCSLENQKCVKSICEEGVKVYTDGHYDMESGGWICYYHYEFSDGSWSPTYWEQSPYSCMY